MDKPLMLVQSNAITEGRYQFDLVEKRIIYFIIHEVRKKYIENNDGQRDIFQDLVVTIPAEQLRKCDSNVKRVYESAKKLRRKDIEINNAEEWLNVGFINYTKHIKKTEMMEIGVSKEILPYIVELTAKFTTYQLAVAITLKSTYTQRFYELTSQWKRAGYFFIKIENLRRMLKCEDKFKTFGEFRRGVLDIAQKEIKELYEQGICDLWFEYEITEKEGKKVKMLNFKVKTKETENKQVFSLDDILHYISSTLKGMFVNDTGYVDRVVSACAKDGETAQAVLEKITKKQNEYSRKEQPLIIRYVLKEDFQMV